MKARSFLSVIAIVLLVAVGIALFAWNTRPKLVGISPLDGGKNIISTASIRLEFSRPMDAASVVSRVVVEPAMEGTFSWSTNELIFTPSKPWQGQLQVKVTLQAGARAATWLSFPMGGLSWSFTTSESSLAYLWPANGPADIYELEPASGSITRYTQGMDVMEFTTSPDGRWLFFSAGNSRGGSDLYRVDRMATQDSAGGLYPPEKLLDCGMSQCRNPGSSSDGSTLAYEYLLPNPIGGLEPAQIWTLKLTGLVAKQAGQTGHETVQPAWSSTGLLAYYDRTSNDYEIYNPVSQERVEFPNQTGQPGTWSLDGEYYLAPEISYQTTGNSYETGSSHLLRYPIQGGRAQDLSGEGAVEDVEAAYSPDRSAIAFTRKYLDANRWSPGRQLWVMGADGADPHPLSDEGDFNHYDLAWSRDGSKLAYVRFNQFKIYDPPELWMVDRDGTNPVQLVIGGYSPIWIP